MAIAKLESEYVKPNDIKKGETVILKREGWKAEMLDNMRGNVRMAKVYGTFEECGSIYVWDIAYVIRDGKNYPIELTAKQKEVEKMNKQMGFRL
jgi:hypothetical protein